MSQTQIILEHFLAGKTLSTFEAYETYNITTLGQRCTELRERGHKVKDKWEKKNGKTYKRYWMDVPDELPFTDRLSTNGEIQG